MNTTPKPPAALIEARKRQATARDRVEALDAEVSRLRDAIEAASRARASAMSSLRAGEKLPPALAQTVAEGLVLSDAIGGEEVALAEAIRVLTDAEATCQGLERQHALAVAAVAERDLVPRVVAAVAALHEIADALEDATRDATNSARDPFERRYFWTRGDRARPHELHSVVREVWREAARVTASKLTDMGLDADAARVKEGTR